MKYCSVSLVTKRVDVSAHVRHIVTARIASTGNIKALNVPARRGPPGRQGDPGPQGEPGNIENLTMLNITGGFF